MHADLPLTAPSLVELCAWVVARDDGRHLEWKEHEISPSSSMDSESQLSSNFSHMTSASHSSLELIDTEDVDAPLVLPTPCSEHILNHVVARFRELSEPETLEGEVETAVRNAERNKFLLRRALHPFTCEQMYPISRLDLSGLTLDDELLARLLTAQQHSLVALNLTAVKNVSAAGVCAILSQRKARFKKAKSLKFSTASLLRVPRARRKATSRKRSLSTATGGDSHAMESGQLASTSSQCSPPSATKLDTLEVFPDFMSFFPSVEHLYFMQGLHYDIEDEQRGAFLSRVFDVIQPGVVYTLDLSEWQNKVQFLSPLTRLHSLTTLILYDVHGLENSIDVIKEIRTLVTLDLSQSDRTTGEYTRPVTALNSLVINLDRLTYLDISGTNLHSHCTIDDRPFRGAGRILSDIPGLRNMQRPLKYLGVFNCDHASHYENLPAEKVSGDYTEDQLLLALEVYMERSRMMHLVLNESYQYYRYSPEMQERHADALHLVIRALDCHRSHISLQIAGSASLFYIIRHVTMNYVTKRKIIKILINGMETHADEQVMVRNCCLSLCQFDIPHDVMFEYLRVADLLVRVLRTHQTDNLTQRITVFLMNSMACHVEGDLKLEVGTMGAIELILSQIQRKYNATTCDDVMEVCWSFLWNITDETPANCDRFLQADGLELFKKCYSQFPNETELLRNMMGLIGNIAEVEGLREQLMEKSFVNIFRRLLTTLTDGIEISYNTAGVLAHMVSDGEAIWSKNMDIPRADVMDDIIRATSKWNLDAKRYINYRSFKPILKLLPLHDSVGSQHWAAWALANLTCTDPDKYCPYVLEADGEELLKSLVENKSTAPRVRELVSIVLHNIRSWRKDPVAENNVVHEITAAGDASHDAEPYDIDMVD